MVDFAAGWCRIFKRWPSEQEDLLPDVDFRDATNHLIEDTEPDGARIVAERIAPLVLEGAHSEGGS